MHPTGVRPATFRGSHYRAPISLVHQRVELRADRDRVWITHRGTAAARYERFYRAGTGQENRTVIPSQLRCLSENFQSGSPMTSTFS